MNDEGIFKPALIGGVLLGIVSALPLISALNCVCCAWVIGGGILAANLYVKSSPVGVTLGRGVILGLLTGVIGAVVDTAFTVPLHLVMSRFGLNFTEQMREVFDQIPNLPPGTREQFQTLLAGGTFGILMIVISGIFKIFAYGIVGMIGGAVGVAIFEKRRPGTHEGPQAPYPPPVDLPPPPPPPPPVIPAGPSGG
jgi:hypothetical protein